MTTSDFLSMIDNGCCPRAVINQMAKHYEEMLTNAINNDVCFSCVDRDVCDRIKWFDDNIKKASRTIIEEKIITQMKCIHYSKFIKD